MNEISSQIMAENKGIQNLLAAEEAAASLVQAAREGLHTDHYYYPPTNKCCQQLQQSAFRVKCGHAYEFNAGPGEHKDVTLTSHLLRPFIQPLACAQNHYSPTL